MDPAGGEGGGSFYNKRYSADSLQRLARHNSANNANALMGNVNNMATSPVMMSAGQSLDEMVEENNAQQQQRRRSLQHYGSGSPAHPVANNMRRPNLPYDSPTHSDYSAFSMATSPLRHPSTVLQNGGGIAKRRMQSKSGSLPPGSKGSQAESPSSVTVNPGLQDLGYTPDPVTQSPLYQQPLDSDGLNMDVTMGGDDLHMGMYGNSMGDHGSNMNMFSGGGFDSIDSVSHQTPGHTTAQPEDATMMGTADDSMLENLSQMNMIDLRGGMSTGGSMGMGMPHVDTSVSGVDMGHSDLMPTMSSAGPIDFDPMQLNHHNNQPGHNQNQNQLNNGNRNNSTKQNMNNFSTGLTNNQQMPRYLNAYSQSGFDMLGVLMRVSSRADPQINIGAVDMSCAFVVCDVSQHDVPIVYCSEMFERLTGYVKHEILGRNCRFLQAPDGRVHSGIKRKYVDDKSVYHLKSMINQQQEAQISLINYRKGGQPFMNLLTMIPIPWDSEEIRYFVGFQVDLVEQPTSITNKNPDGSYSINYQRGLLPRYIVHNTPETNNKAQDLESGHTIDRDEVSTVLSTIGTGDSEYSKRIWDKVVIENTDDVVHVLSLKGLFQYLSPSCKKILEYEPSELVGTPLSSVCHPSDIVPVTRELKDTAPGGTVNVVFRIRRKHSGYTWFESHGSLHTEQGKGKKCIILLGRERPVYALQRRDIISESEIGDNELWTKMSTSGMFLFVSTHSKSLLDRQPEDLLGSSVQALMRMDSKEVFNRMLELARGGKIVTFKHDIQNRRGQTLHAQSTLYPGDANEGQKPTFLIAQTKLLKMSRERASAAAALARQSSPGDTISQSPYGSSSSTPFSQAPMPSKTIATTQDAIVTSAGNHGLLIGSQHEALASEDNVFDELKTTRSTSWQFELRQMEKKNRVLAEELQSLNSSKKKRKRRKGLGQLQKDCANCHTRNTPEWRRGPSGNRDLCNSCGLRWAKQQGRVSPRTPSQSDKASGSPANSVGSAGKQVLAASSPAQKRSAKEQKSDSHMAKTARMEAPANSGFGGGIPTKIEEVAEPPESSG